MLQSIVLKFCRKVLLLKNPCVKHFPTIVRTFSEYWCDFTVMTRKFEHILVIRCLWWEKNHKISFRYSMSIQHHYSGIQMIYMHVIRNKTSLGCLSDHVAIKAVIHNASDQKQQSPHDHPQDCADERIQCVWGLSTARQTLLTNGWV